MQAIQLAQQATSFSHQAETNKAEALRLHALSVKWDHAILKLYLVQKKIYPETEVDRVCEEYCRFIALSLAHPGLPVPISEAVDKFWHAHIIFTENYRAFGEHIIGGYIDHRPSILDGQQSLQDAFSLFTLKVYRDCFGEPEVKYWDMTCCKRCTCQGITSLKH